MSYCEPAFEANVAISYLQVEYQSDSCLCDLFFIFVIVMVGFLLPEVEGPIPVFESQFSQTLCVVRGGLSSNDSFTATITTQDTQAGSYI